MFSNMDTENLLVIHMHKIKADQTLLFKYGRGNTFMYSERTNHTFWMTWIMFEVNLQASWSGPWKFYLITISGLWSLCILDFTFKWITKAQECLRTTVVMKANFHHPLIPHTSSSPKNIGFKTSSNLSTFHKVVSLFKAGSLLLQTLHTVYYAKIILSKFITGIMACYFWDKRIHSNLKQNLIANTKMFLKVGGMRIATYCTFLPQTSIIPVEKTSLSPTPP